MSSSTGKRYLFLMRHAEHEAGQLTSAGAGLVTELSARFAEWLEGEEWRAGGARSIRLLVTSRSATEVLQTADHLTRDVLAGLARAENPRGNPFIAKQGWPSAEFAPSFPADREDWMAMDLAEVLGTERPFGFVPSASRPPAGYLVQLCELLDTSDEAEEQASDGGGVRARRSALDAPLLIGNDPLIDWVASRLTRTGIAVARGELVCLSKGVSDGKWKLIWTISGDSDVQAEAILTKIRSKMTTATSLGTVIVGLTTFLLQSALKEPSTVFQWLAFACLGVSAALYFATLFLYDSLTMPKRFWASSPPQNGKLASRHSVWSRIRHGHRSVQRPPSSTARVLQSHMVRIWKWVFLPATVIAAIGVALLAVGAAVRPCPAMPPWWMVPTAIAGLTVLVMLWVAYQRPNLGASD